METQLGGALLETHFVINLSENHTERCEKKKPDVNMSLRST